MAKEHIDAGSLNDRIEIRRVKQETGRILWATLRRSWAKAEATGKTSVYSSRAIGGAGVKFILRRQDLRLDDAIGWRGQHCLITSILPLGRMHLQVEAAMVEVRSCADRYGEAPLLFPAVLTEKYVRHGEMTPMDVNAIHGLLITPKAVTLRPGRLVEVDGVSWPILTAHLLDPNKNEYEIARTVDL